MLQIENSLSDLTVTQDSAPRTLDIFAVFADNNYADTELEYTVIENTNSEVVNTSNLNLNEGTLDDPSISDRGGNGAIRLVTIDPTENQITEETFFCGFRRADHRFPRKARIG